MRRILVVPEITIIGDVRDKNVVIVDDMVDTAGTILLAAKKMEKMGARSVRAVATHPVLSGRAAEKIQRSSIMELVVTDTISLRNRPDKITVLTVSDLFAEVIDKVYNHQSISPTFYV